MGGCCEPVPPTPLRRFRYSNRTRVSQPWCVSWYVSHGRISQLDFVNHECLVCRASRLWVASKSGWHVLFLQDRPWLFVRLGSHPLGV